MEKVYWTMADGRQINVDDMELSHLRNTLKMIIRNSKKVKKEIKPKFQLMGEIANDLHDMMMDMEYANDMNYCQWL